ncbi:hypothetical protein HHK36_013266 [Tetracentron sinense]|uniref:MADS-box domain-containing protein n=1 Tax=Tetracentron sinense TaxID=13715 RepID=A0A834Z9I1_TETSI|nr:hypothetical protein HHK36_013266 [Tetracentron sinense]
MGRRKLEMQKIESLKARQVCFSKRRKGLFKKASDLSAISGLDIAVVVFSPAGKPFVLGNPGQLLNSLPDDSDSRPMEMEMEIDITNLNLDQLQTYLNSLEQIRFDVVRMMQLISFLGPVNEANASIDLCPFSKDEKEVHHKELTCTERPTVDTAGSVPVFHDQPSEVPGFVWKQEAHLSALVPLHHILFGRSCRYLLSDVCYLSLMKEMAGEAIQAVGESAAKKESGIVKKQQKGMISHIWNRIFSKGSNDFEKRLQHISKEETSVLARMKKRSQSSCKNEEEISKLAEDGEASYNFLRDSRG